MIKRLFEKYSLSIVFGFMGFVFGSVGVGFVIGGMSNQQQIETTQSIPLFTAAQLAEVVSGTPVSVEGRISERNESAFEGLVIYTEHQYRGTECDSDGDCREVWLETERVTPALWLDVAGDRVRLNNTDYALYYYPEIWQTTPELVEYETREYRGFRRGALVYVSGRVKTNDGVTIEAEFVSGGSRDDYVAARRAEVFFLLLFGLIFGGIGIAFLTTAFVTAVKKGSKTSRKS